ISANRASVTPITPGRLGRAGGAGGAGTSRSHAVAAPPPVPVIWCYHCGVTGHRSPECPDAHLTQEEAMRKNVNLANPALVLVAAVAVLAVVEVVVVVAVLLAPTRVCPVSKPEQEELKKQIKDYLAKGMIEPSSSPYAAPILFVQKKSGKCALVYLGDILVMSKSLPEHMQHLRLVFDLLHTNKLYAKMSKCESMQLTLKFLGHVISVGAISVDPDKVAALRREVGGPSRPGSSAPAPTDHGDLGGEPTTNCLCCGRDGHWVPHWLKKAAGLTLSKPSKKSGELRMCIDYRQLNKITLCDQYPLPRIDDLFDKLSGCKVFCSLDLQAGYHQIKITPEDVPKTAFCTPEGHFQFKVLCFGLTNAPATFQRDMNDAFATVLGKCALVYLEDILVMS
ncbi:hypothetical protein QJQ45_021590, partial [Haematococcus lacustris]